MSKQYGVVCSKMIKTGLTLFKLLANAPFANSC